MRALLSSVGTRGDVQPVVAVARALRALGHTVRLCVPPNFTEEVARLGFEAVSVGVAMRASPPDVPPAPLPDLITDQFASVGAAAEGCELILGGGAHQYAARSIAERLGIPCVIAVYAPVSLPSVDLAPPGTFSEPAEAAIPALWEANKRGWNDRGLERVNANRARLGLAPIDDVLGHILGDSPWLAADATLGPAPSTPGLRVFQTGAWILEDHRPLPPAVKAFLDDGEPPIYLGFGSMPAREGTSRTLIDAARAAGRRVLLSQGWAELGLVDEAPDCLALGDVNHTALFPRVAAVVHHGGAGTTTTAARAGVPQVAVPMFGDQPYWGRRLRALGIGTAVPSASLSVESLASALQEVLHPAYAQQARALAPRIRTDGAERAARRLVQERPGFAVR